ncbi:glycosyltransferase family 2 protein [Phocaeicola plebeius]|uniref:glycosyltransferase family 2 protein n=1 Tax=Phocaeicola plebeius TaxID=310297 RepID=UPI0026EDB8F5|nr:glycosyltransferase family 2 protein [Phocaeicola plebeius]
MKEKSNIIISIIIPIYNLENRNLRRCIDSIIKQTYKNFELLLINDGSTDNSINICKEYAELDERIKLIHKENGGASSARNLGIEHSQGEYIAFIDGDDYIDNDYLEHFVQRLPADLILQSCSDFCYDYDRAKTQYHFQNKDYIDDFYELFAKYNLYNWGAPWGRLFKSHIVKEHNIRFEQDIHFREDELFFITYLKFCSLIKTESYYGYHYMWYPTSATHKYYGFNHNYKIATEIYLRSTQLWKIKSFNDNFKQVISSKCICSLFISLSSMYKAENINLKNRLKNIKRVKKFIKEQNLVLISKYKLLTLPAFLIDQIFYWKILFQRFKNISIKTEKQCKL